MFPETSPKILIVDSADRTFYDRLLDCAELLQAVSIQEALSICQSQAIDAVISEFVLSDGNGLDLLDRITNLPIIVVTDQGDENIAVQCLKRGAADYLVKRQMTAENLTAAVKSAIADAKSLQNTQQQLEETQYFIRRIAEAVPGMLYIYDLIEQRNVYINRHAEELLGYSPEQIRAMGENVLAKLIHPEDLDRIPLHHARFQTVQNAEILTIEYRMQNANQEWSWFQTHEVLFSRTPEGMPHQILGISQEITPRKKAEADLRESEANAQAARAEAEAANRSKDEFLAVVSHELRSPLNSILGWAKLLQARKYDEATVKRALATIERNAQAQSQLIEDLLDVTRMVRGDLRINLAPVNLSTVVETAIVNHQLAAEAKQITLRSRIEHSIPPILGDVQRLQQVITNLLTNSIKFTPEQGSVEISLSIAEQDSSQAEIIVSDTGKGIDPEFLPYIFDRFSQSDSIQAKEGLGLGLAIVHHLVELHHGTIEAESPGLGLGATFRVRLPLIVTP